jgi:hypothetical protein
MDDSLDEAAPWVSAAAAAPPDEHRLGTGAQAADALLRSGKIEAVSTRNAPDLSANLLRYGPHAALAAWLLGVAWLAGSSFVGPARTVAQQDSAQRADAEVGPQKADVEALRAAQSPSIKDAIELGNAKPGLDAAKTEIGGGDREASGKAERPRSKSAERLSKSSERLDRIGLEIAALLAAAPAADPSAAVAPVARRPAQNARHDAFDPLQNPTAPGAPRPLGTIARAATVANSAENEYGHRAN